MMPKVDAYTIIGLGLAFWAVGALVILALCVAASDADDIAEAYEQCPDTFPQEWADRTTR